MLQRSSMVGCVCLFVCVMGLTWATEVRADKSGVGPTVLSLPQGPGSLGGIGENVRANLNMGLMSYPISIEIPGGRGQATPEISLSYSSSAGAGLMGIGWNLNAGGSISRLTVRGLPQYTNEDRFYGNGELVKIPQSPFYRARIEGSFMRYRWIQKDAADQRGYWVVEYPDGAKGYYGANAKGEVDLDSQVYGLQGTYQWELRTFVDRNGNRVEYTYFKDNTQVYMDQVSWVLDANDKPLYQLKFKYESRPDPISDGKPGFDLQTLQRIKEIQITSAGQSFRSYTFHYEDSTGLSRLIQVTRYGRDGKEPYPVAFSMKYSNATFSKENSRLVTMPTALGIDFSTGKADFLDINGDGLPDVIDTTNSNHVFHINTLTLDENMQQKAHDYATKITNPNATSGAQLNSASIQMIDYNGDGFTDMVDAVNKAIYINKGNGKWESAGGLVSFPVDGKDADMRFFDYNGDKAIDVISSNGSVTTYWVSDGKGNWKQEDGRPNLGVSVSKERIRFIDINGDGLNDAVHILKSSLRYKKYLGYGNWSDWIEMKVPDIEKYELSTRAQFNDINGDGMADMVVFLGNSIVYFVNKNGREFSAPVTIQDFGGQSIPDSTKSSVRIVDMNGNGSRDIVWIDSSGKVTYLELFSERPNLLREISNGIGQRINISYGSSVNFYLRDLSCDKAKDKACSGPWQNKMPMPFTLVTQIATWASRSNKPAEQVAPTPEERPQIQKVYYHDGFYDGIEKQFRGFRHVETLLDGDASQKARKDEIMFNVGETDSYFHGKQISQMIADEDGKVYAKNTFDWQDCGTPAGADKNLDPPVRFICLKVREQQVIEGLPNEAKTLRMETEYDGYGNRVMLAELGVKDKEGDEKYEKTTFIMPSNPKDPASKWMLRYPQKIEVCEKKDGPCAVTEHFYDGEEYKGLPAGEITKGNLTRVRLQVEAGKDEYVETTRRKFDAYGNVVGTMTAEGMLRTIEWEPVYFRFATKETIHLPSRVIEFSTLWDYALSAVVQSTDGNGQVSRYNYDTFGRLLAVYQPGDTDDKPTVRYTYDWKAPLSQIITELRSVQGGDYDRKSIQCFDGLNRKLAVLQETKPGTFSVIEHTEFNREGHIARQWRGYDTTTGCSFVAPSEAALTQYFYDGLGREIKMVNPDNSFQRYEYKPLQREVYDEEDNKQDSPHFNTPAIFKMDGFSRVIEEIQTLSKDQTIRTQFAYSLLNPEGVSKQTVVTFADGSQKKQEYNLLGNVVKVTDPDRSTISYTYNKDNKVLSVTDARGVKVVFTHDGLERILTQQEDGKPETKVTYFYDEIQSEFPEATYLKGRLARVDFPGGKYLFSYDGKGNLNIERRSIAGVTMDVRRTYTHDSKIKTMEMPNGRVFDYKRDLAGRVVGIGDKIQDIAYHPAGMILSWSAGNRVESRYTYDKRYHIQTMEIGGGQVFRMSYQLDGHRNPLAIDEKHGDQTSRHEYMYDSLYRLTQAKLDNSTETINYVQDKLHNLVSKTSSLDKKSLIHIGDYTYDKSRIHAVQKAGDTELKYDAAGHLANRGNLAFVWDHLGRYKQATQGGQPVMKSWYDHTNRRIVRQEHGLHTIALAPFYEIREGAVVSYLNIKEDRVVAIWTVKGVEQFFDDLAPAEGDKELKAKPDGKITAGDAWLYHAGRNKILTVPMKPRPYDLDFTQDMLMSSVQRLLLGDDKEVTHYYHLDHLASVRAVTDDSGTVVQRKHYYPYGLIRAVAGDKTLFSFGFQNTEWDASTQSNVFLKRAFDPKLGRWLSPDPLFAATNSPADEFNSYGMVQNNPIRNRDREGTSTDPSGFLGENGQPFANFEMSGGWQSALVGVGFGVAVGAIGLAVARKRGGGHHAARNALALGVGVAGGAAVAGLIVGRDSNVTGMESMVAAAAIAVAVGLSFAVKKAVEVKFNLKASDLKAQQRAIASQGKKVEIKVERSRLDFELRAKRRKAKQMIRSNSGLTVQSTGGSTGDRATIKQQRRPRSRNRNKGP